jgi:PAS domain S-box-containing protein
MKEVLNEIYDHLPFGVIVTNTQGNILNINDKASELLKTQEKQLMNQPISSILLKSNIVKAIKTGEPEISTVTNEANQTFLLIEKPIQGNALNKMGLILIYDSTYVDQLAFHSENVSELKQELDLIINLIGELVTITDGNGKILRVNAACERVMGVTEREFVGKPANVLEQQRIIDFSSTKQVIEQGRKVTVVQTTKSGRRLMVSGFPIYNEHGKLIKVINISKDITEVDKLNKELEETKQLIQQYQSELFGIEQRDSEPIIVKSKVMEEIYELVGRVADVDSTILILGESGVGKEILARTLHKLSSRKEKPFLKINCGAIPESLMESELFGYTKGTFTGASKEGKSGLIYSANHGTLFLDEIGELPLHLQVKLLQVLQEKQVTPLGKTTPIDVNVRFIAATNRNIEEMVQKGLFREDLYYRLNVVPITIPSLRERTDDIPFLIEHFFKMYNRKYGKNKTIHAKAIQLLMEYPWYGNVRELQNTVERLVVTISDQEISPNHLPQKMMQLVDINHQSKSLKDSVEQFEKNVIQKTLHGCKTMKEASEKLGVDASTISRKIKKHKIKIAHLH